MPEAGFHANRSSSLSDFAPPAASLYDRHAALAVRVVALAVVVATAVRLATTWQGWNPPALLRVMLLVFAGGIAWAASARRTRSALNVLALALLLGVPVQSVALMTLEPASVWKLGAITIGVLLLAVILIAWSWWWQLLLTALLVPGTLAAAWAFTPATWDVADQFVSLALTLGAVGVAGVVGASLLSRARGHLAASEARYRALFQGAHDGVIVMDHTGRIVAVNARFADLVGRPATALQGTEAAECLAPLQPNGRPGRELFEKYFTLALNGQPGVIVGHLQGAGGRPVEVEMACARVEKLDGPMVQVVVRDLSEHRLLQRRQEREQRLEAVGRLVGGVAHRFNNLLAAVMNYATVLKDAARSPEDREAAEAILDAAREGAELSRELMRFGRQERMRLERVTPAQLASRIEALARATLLPDVTIVVELEPDLPDVAGDTDQLVHAALQLILNARDAMPRGGELQLEAARVALGPRERSWAGAAPGDYVRFSIGDSGTGMDLAVLERVFEPFFTAKPMYEARGVGLAAVYGVVRAHHGSVRIDSEPGVGTTVHLLIPVWREAAPVPGRATRPLAREPRGRILVVDDEEAVRSSVRRALARMGYDVLEARDAESALQEFHSASPPVDLVLLDMVLPGGGERVFAELKRQCPDVSIIISSGYMGEADEAAAQLRLQGATAFLPKPYELEDLAAAVARGLGEEH